MIEQSSSRQSPGEEQTHPDAVGKADAATSGGRRSLLEWQIALLPMMTVMLVGLTLFFFVASFVQLNNLHNSISNSPSVQLERTITVVNSEVHRSSAEILRAGELQILAALEGYALDRRYHQANVLLMSRVWTRYLGFVTGMILALVGSSFILGKLRGDQNNASVTVGPMSAAFQGTEPGLILAGLGVALMITTIVTHHEISTEDAPTFMQVWMRRTLGDEIYRAPSLDLDGLDFADESFTDTNTVSDTMPSLAPSINAESTGGAPYSSE